MGQVLRRYNACGNSIRILSRPVSFFFGCEYTHYPASKPIHYHACIMLQFFLAIFPLHAALLCENDTYYLRTILCCLVMLLREKFIKRIFFFRLQIVLRIVSDDHTF